MRPTIPAFAGTSIAWLRERHPEREDLRSIVKIRAKRINKKTGEETEAERLYVSSLPPKPGELLGASRAHWCVENTLHWTLDVTFGDDASRLKKDYAPRNFAALKRIALNLLKTEKSKIGIKRKRIKAALNPEFLRKIIDR